MKARRIRSGSRKPTEHATSSIDSPEDCTRSRATSIRNRSTAFDGEARLLRRLLHRQRLIEMLARPTQQRPEAAGRRLQFKQ